MRDAMGGLVNIVIIVVFMVIVSGYLAFNVNYTKAFRVKNKIISTYEQYEGNCESTSSKCVTEIVEYMRQIGYDRKVNLKSIERDGYVCPDGYGYCYKKVEARNDTNVNDNSKYYYKIVTQITIDIPIINRVMANLNTFRVTGDTKTFTVRVK